MLSVSQLLNLDLDRLKRTDPIIVTIKQELLKNKGYTIDKYGRLVFYTYIVIGYKYIKEAIQFYKDYIINDNPLMFKLLENKIYLKIAQIVIQTDQIVYYSPAGIVDREFWYYDYDKTLRLLQKGEFLCNNTYIRLYDWYIARELLLIWHRSSVKLPKDIIKMIFFLLK